LDIHSQRLNLILTGLQFAGHSDALRGFVDAVADDPDASQGADR
jgi:hypothetical protein